MNFPDDPGEREPAPTHALPWIRSAPTRPLCDVPWTGNVVVLATGEVNFCCFSTATIGNVNERSFAEIWNGDTIRRIRRELAEHRLPPECRSVSCPIYRGDKGHHINARLVGMYSEELTGASDPHREIRAGFAQTSLRVRMAGQRLAISLEISYRGSPLFADLFVCVVPAKGGPCFLPGGETYPVPAEVGMKLGENESARTLELFSPEPLTIPETGPREVCVAFFESGSRPHVPSNCYWSTSLTLETK